ncbi:MAG: hypothetical protein BAJALOKI1v1_2440006 [Promethearchaeota archaeon]|nr:MAG: hypothetical protein BAJALOKI1v1_2440006 [Candidatus Lokiarchaeota archaeon]
MQYNDILEKLLPDLKCYLYKLKWNLQGYIDDKDLFQEAIFETCEAVNKADDVRQPEQFIKTVFYRSVNNIQGRVVRERDNKKEAMKDFRKYSEPEFEKQPIIDGIENGLQGTTKEVWQELKRQRGNIAETAERLGYHEQNIYYHRNKLKDKYLKLKKVL